MSRMRERLWRVLDQMPSYAPGRLDLGFLDVVVVSRDYLAQSCDDTLRLGARIQQRDPGFLAGLDERQNPAPVRHLRAIEAPAGAAVTVRRKTP